jgi:hypothetical protein
VHLAFGQVHEVIFTTHQEQTNRPPFSVSLIVVKQRKRGFAGDISTYSACRFYADSFKGDPDWATEYPSSFPMV